MAVADDLLDLEHRFWDASAAGWGDFYRRRCTPDAVFVFGPTGPIDLATCAAAIDGTTAPWTDVHLSGSRVVPLGEHAALLTYRASARQEGDEAAADLYVSSAYVRDGEQGWRMAFHQQTPAA
jgi:hypothetical protein